MLISNNLVIQPVTLADVEAISILKKAVWPEEAADPALIAMALQTPSHQAFMAVVAGEPAGFASCFATKAQTGAKRWEVDLLAVHPSFRRMGIANQLIAKAVEAGTESQAAYTRGLIAVANIGSQKSFARQGYHTDGTIYMLHVSTQPPLTETEKPLGTHLVEVYTFSYQGIWLEGGLSSDAFSAAQTASQRNGLGLVGVLIPNHQDTAKTLAVKHSYEPVALYQWWTRSL